MLKNQRPYFCVKAVVARNKLGDKRGEIQFLGEKKREDGRENEATSGITHLQDGEAL